MASILHELWKAKDSAPPTKCPIEEKAPDSVQVYPVPEYLRAVVVLYEERRTLAAKVANENRGNDGGAWYRLHSEAESVFRLLCEALRVEKKFSLCQRIELHKDWGYSIHS